MYVCQPVSIFLPLSFHPVTIEVTSYKYCTFLIKLFCSVCLDLLIDALFKPGLKLNPEHKPKYLYIISYAASVVEVWKKVQRSFASPSSFIQAWDWHCKNAISYYIQGPIQHLR